MCHGDAAYQAVSGTLLPKPFDMQRLVDLLTDALAA